MQVEKIHMTKMRARELYRKYKEHRHYSGPIDHEIQRAYQLIAQGKVIIKAIESIKTAGADELGRPNLAIARATATHCFYYQNSSGTGGRLSSNDNSWRHWASDIVLPEGTFPDVRKHVNYRGAQAVLPIIPLDLRPKRGLANYHILWEAEWSPLPPRDPYLLRRIGKADLWLVVAAWDLTEIERAAMSTRILVS